MFNFVRIKGLTSKGIVGNQPTTKLAPLKLTSAKLKRQASRRGNMKTYKIQATEINQWFKEVKAKTEKDALKKINEYWSGDENNFSFENFENGKTETNFKIIDIQASEQKG